MKPNTRRQLAWALTLAAVAGCVDAVAYLRLAHHYVAVMGGNSTSIGVALARGNWPVLAEAAILIGSFVIGSGLGSALGTLAGARRVLAVLLAEELLLLGVYAALPELAGGRLGRLPIVFLAVAMGVQNVAVRHIGGESVGLTYVTGTLAKLGQALGEMVVRPEKVMPEWPRGLELAALWTAFVIGAGIGATLDLRLGSQALIVPIVAIGILIGLAARDPGAVPAPD